LHRPNIEHLWRRRAAWDGTVGNSRTAPAHERSEKGSVTSGPILLIESEKTFDAPRRGIVP
jgi:hypothetical protein